MKKEIIMFGELHSQSLSDDSVLQTIREMVHTKQMVDIYLESSFNWRDRTNNAEQNGGALLKRLYNDVGICELKQLKQEFPTKVRIHHSDVRWCTKELYKPSTRYGFQTMSIGFNEAMVDMTQLHKDEQIVLTPELVFKLFFDANYWHFWKETTQNETYPTNDVEALNNIVTQILYDNYNGEKVGVDYSIYQLRVRNVLLNQTKLRQAMMKQLKCFCSSNVFHFDEQETIQNIVNVINIYPSISSGVNWSSMTIIPDIFAFLRMFRTFVEPSSMSYLSADQPLCIYIAHTEHCRNLERILHMFFLQRKQVSYQSKNLCIGYYPSLYQYLQDNQRNEQSLLKEKYNTRIADDYFEVHSSSMPQIMCDDIAKIMYVQIGQHIESLDPTILKIRHSYPSCVHLYFERYVTTTQDKAPHIQKLLEDQNNWFLSLEKLNEKMKAGAKTKQAGAKTKQAGAKTKQAGAKTKQAGAKAKQAGAKANSILPLLVTIIALTMVVRKKKTKQNKEK